MQPPYLSPGIYPGHDLDQLNRALLLYYLRLIPQRLEQPAWIHPPHTSQCSQTLVLCSLGFPDSLKESLGVSYHNCGGGGVTLKFLFLLRNGTVCMATQKPPQSRSPLFPSNPHTSSWSLGLDLEKALPFNWGEKLLKETLCLKGKEVAWEA